MSNSPVAENKIEQIYNKLKQDLNSEDSINKLKLVQNELVANNDCIEVPADIFLQTINYLKGIFDLLLDVTAVDYPNRQQRFDIVYHFNCSKTNQRLRIKVAINENQEIPSIHKIFKASNWFERETFDMFGIVFSNHPNLKRILCHNDFVGHPLRKDYPADKNQSLRTPIEHTFLKDKERMLKDEDHLSDKVWINIGPAHPATHGTLRLMAVLSGETIDKLDTEIGYLHRCFEKMCETHSYNQIIPYTDRLNYCSAPINNHAWCKTIEKMMDITIPDRAQVLRMIIDEFSRIIDHLVCVSTNAVDLGALTNFWLGFQARERVYDLFESLCGARLTVSLARVGGMGFDLPKGWVAEAKEVLKDIRRSASELDLLLTKNRIFTQRMVGIGEISQESALGWGITGPALRATGLAYDARIYEDYYKYRELEWDVVVGERGDSYNRYMVRMEEIQQSISIIEQLLDNIPGGPVSIDDPSIVLPEKKDVYGNIEGLMNQFMLVINGFKTPPAEIYSAHETANGEMGFYVVSDGTDKPYRVKCRAPSFVIFQSFPELTEGGLIADAIATLGSINIIAGELDR